MRAAATVLIERIEQAWNQRSVVWLSGVRRVGRTTLCRSLRDVEYFDCELPRTRRTMEDPEAFLRSFGGKRVVLDRRRVGELEAEVVNLAELVQRLTKLIG